MMRQLIRLILTVTFTSVVMHAVPPLQVEADSEAQISAVATLRAASIGSTVFDYYELSVTQPPYGSVRHSLPTHRPGRYCFYSTWTLLRINPVEHTRKYGVVVYDACNHDRQVFPVPANPLDGACQPDDNLHPSIHFSLCPSIGPGHAPAGLAPADCAAAAVGYTTLDASLSPPLLDPTIPTPLTLSTAFAADTTQSLAEGSCLAALSWTTLAWTIRWPDGASTSLGPSGQQGITTTHTVPPTSTPQAATVVAVAHLHLHGLGLDFDPSGSLVVVPRDADVDVSNLTTAAHLASAPLYSPPLLQVAAVPVGQTADGQLPTPLASTSPLPHAVTLRGRLLALYPRARVLRPASLSVDGVVVATGSTSTVSWTYLGAPTDAPPSQATPSGASGSPTQPVLVQYNHAARLDPSGAPLDETVPLRLVTTTTFPDGHSETDAVDGTITVTIYYPALADPG